MFGRFAALLRRRVVQPWTFSPAALFRPFPRAKRSLWSLPTAPERAKYDGADEAGAMPSALLTYVLLHSVAVVAVGYVCLENATSLPPSVILALIAGVFASVSVIGGLFDRPWHTAAETIRVAALAALCIFAPDDWVAAAAPQPWHSMLLQPGAAISPRRILAAALVGGWWLALRLSPCALPPESEHLALPSSQSPVNNQPASGQGRRGRSAGKQVS
jgi:hypothetical protein